MSSILTDSVRLHVKNKHLISTLSRHQIPQSSIYHVDDSKRCYQRNLLKEFQSISQQTKYNHGNNNVFDDKDSTENISSSFKNGKNEVLFLNKETVRYM